MSYTLTGTQSGNNVYPNGGNNITGYTDQTGVSGQYITATGLTATVGSDNKTVTYTISGQRGAAVQFSGTSITGGKVWDYKNNGTTVTNYSDVYTFDANGSYLSKVTLSNPNSTSVTVQLTSPVVITGFMQVVVVGSIVKRVLTLTPTQSGVTSDTWYISQDQSSWTQFSTAFGTTTYTFPASADGTYYFKCVASDGSSTATSNIISQYAMEGSGGSSATNHDQAFVTRYHI